MRMILHIRFFLFDAVVVFIVFLIYVKHLVVSDSRARLRSTPACKVFRKNTGAGTARMIFAETCKVSTLHRGKGYGATFAKNRNGRMPSPPFPFYKNSVEPFHAILISGSTVRQPSMPRVLFARIFPSRLFRGILYLWFGERERDVILLVECQGRVERRPFLALEALDELGRSRRKELREVLVGQFLVQKVSENEQPATLVVAFGELPADDDFPLPALWAYDTAACRFGETDGKHLFGDRRA